MDHGVPKGTFRFEVRSVPTTKEDLALIGWAASAGSLWVDTQDLPSQLAATRFDLPYNQNGGLVYVEKVPEAQWRQYLAQNDKEPEGTYTGWWLFDTYTDSMTSEFSSPIYRTGSEEFPFITEDY